MRTWEATIKHIRTLPDFTDLVNDAYLNEDLVLNVERFGESQEFKETLKLIQYYQPSATSLLDIGCGNGISAINFARQGFEVSAVEPDPSTTVGSGAIKILQEELNLNNLEIYEDYAEHLNFEDNTFDVVYVRQAMHHAKELNAFIAECGRVLRPKGLLLTIRDHVVFDKKDKEWFLKMHPLHKFYGGENAYSPQTYRKAFKLAAIKVVKELKYFDSIINYFPMSKKDVKEVLQKQESIRREKLENKIGALGKNPLVWRLYKWFSGYNPGHERNIPGRMYTYIASKT